MVVRVEWPVAQSRRLASPVIGVDADNGVVAGVAAVVNAGVVGLGLGFAVRVVAVRHGVTLACGVMATKLGTTSELQGRVLRRGDRVRLVSELPGVPLGAEGKVAMANGFTWNRYWVRFADGQVVGHVDHSDLVRSKHYERFLVARERELLQAEEAAQQVAAATDASDAGAPAGDGGTGDAVINGVTIPAYLLKRSADARERLGA